MKETKFQKPRFVKPENPEKQFLEKFLVLRDVYTENPNTEKSKFKKDFYTKLDSFVYILIQVIKNKKVTDPGIYERYSFFHEFVEKLKKEKFEKDELASKENIAVANNFLNYIIAELQK